MISTGGCCWGEKTKNLVFFENANGFMACRHGSIAGCSKSFKIHPANPNIPTIFIWVWVNTYRYIFSGMNIHLPAILGLTRYLFDPSPYIKFPAYDLHGIVGETTNSSMAVPLSQIFPDQQFPPHSKQTRVPTTKMTLTKISPRKIADKTPTKATKLIDFESLKSHQLIPQSSRSSHPSNSCG